MAKKVALDVLDIDLDHRLEEEAPPPVDPSAEGPAANLEPAPRRARRPWPAWLRRPRIWLLALAIAAVAAVAAAVLLTFHSTGGRPAKEAAPAVNALADVAPVAEPLILLAGFLVDLTDERGPARLLLCDVALMPQKQAALQKPPDWTATRSLIYLTLKGQKIEELLSPAGRQQLKAKLRDEMNARGETPAIEAIYFTAFEII